MKTPPLATKNDVLIYFLVVANNKYIVFKFIDNTFLISFTYYN